jgi:hypothetical protein
LVGSGYWEAAQLFIDALQAAVARVTPAILRSFPPFAPDESVFRLALSVPRAPLNGGGGRYSLAIGLRFRVEPDAETDARWDVRTFAYFYQLYVDDREYLAYHWDHEGVSTGGVSTPHAHFGKELPHAGMPRADRDDIHALAAAHMPTGPIAFTEVLRMVVREFGVEPFRLQGESEAESRVSAERAFGEAESALRDSFAWFLRMR